MPGDDHDGVGRGDLGRDGQHAVHAGDPDVVHPPAADAARGQGRGDLGGHRRRRTSRR